MNPSKTMSYLDLKEAVEEINKNLNHFEDTKNDCNSSFEQMYDMQEMIYQACIVISEANSFINASLHEQSEER